MTKTIKIKYYHDAGHGWLAVKKKLLAESGLESEISAFSYQKGQTVYLEEDCDAFKFVKAMEAKGYAFDVDDRYCERSPIRSYASFTV